MPISGLDVKLLTSKDGTAVYADAIGDPSKPNLVFVHGYALSGEVFNNIFSDPQYRKDYYLVRYDMRGHGRSGKPDKLEGYKQHLYAEDFEVVLKAFNLRKPVVIGWSLGATVMSDIALCLPSDTMSGLVMIGGVPSTGTLPRIRDDALKAIIHGLTTFSDAPAVTRDRLTFADSVFCESYKAAGGMPWEEKCAWIGMTVHQPPHVSKFVVDREQDESGLFKLGAAGLPLLIIQASEDAHEGPAGGEVLFKEMSAQFTKIKRVTIKGGHAIHYEKPAETMATIIDFVKTI